MILPPQLLAVEALGLARLMLRERQAVRGEHLLPVLEAEFDESKVKRADDGKFGEGGGKKGKEILDNALASAEEIEGKTKTARPRQITPVNAVGHDIRSKRHLEEIAASMKQDGWIGPPLLVVRDEDDWQAWTGSHRLKAAELAELDEIPVVFVKRSDVEEWAAAAGLEESYDELAGLDDEAKWELMQHADNKVAAELMRLEVSKEQESRHLREAFDESQVKRDHGQFAEQAGAGDGDKKEKPSHEPSKEVADLKSALATAGVKAFLDKDGDLSLTPAVKVTPELLSQVRTNKPEMIAHLKAEAKATEKGDTYEAAKAAWEAEVEKIAADYEQAHADWEAEGERQQAEYDAEKTAWDERDTERTTQREALDTDSVGDVFGGLEGYPDTNHTWDDGYREELADALTSQLDTLTKEFASDDGTALDSLINAGVPDAEITKLQKVAAKGIEQVRKVSERWLAAKDKALEANAKLTEAEAVEEPDDPGDEPEEPDPIHARDAVIDGMPAYADDAEYEEIAAIDKQEWETYRQEKAEWDKADKEYPKLSAKWEKAQEQAEKWGAKRDEYDAAADELETKYDEAIDDLKTKLEDKVAEVSDARREELDEEEEGDEEPEEYDPDSFAYLQAEPEEPSEEDYPDEPDPADYEEEESEETEEDDDEETETQESLLFESEEPDDPQARAQLLAELLTALYGDRAEEYLEHLGSEAVTEAIGLCPHPVDVHLLEAGFSGTIKDKRGRTLHYRDGKRVAGVKPEKAAKVKAVRPSVDEVHAHVQGLHATSSIHQHAALVNSMGRLTVKGLMDLKRKMGIKASGAKATLVAKIATRLYGGDVKKTPLAVEQPSEVGAKPTEPTPAASEQPAAPPAPGFTGTDAHGHEWRDGKQVAQGAEGNSDNSAPHPLPTSQVSSKITPVGDEKPKQEKPKMSRQELEQKYGKLANETGLAPGADSDSLPEKPAVARATLADFIHKGPSKDAEWRPVDANSALRNGAFGGVSPSLVANELVSAGYSREDVGKAIGEFVNEFSDHENASYFAPDHAKKLSDDAASWLKPSDPVKKPKQETKMEATKTPATEKQMKYAGTIAETLKKKLAKHLDNSAFANPEFDREAAKASEEKIIAAILKDAAEKPVEFIDAYQDGKLDRIIEERGHKIRMNPKYKKAAK